MPASVGLFIRGVCSKSQDHNEESLGCGNAEIAEVLKINRRAVKHTSIASSWFGISDGIKRVKLACIEVS
jgi:hypothetical protein